MTSENKKQEGLALFAVLLGCKPKGRNVEQHDVFFGVAEKLDDLSDNIKEFWYDTILDELGNAAKKISPDMDGKTLKEDLLASLSKRDKVHIDAWTKVDYADGYKINIVPKENANTEQEQKLYFINLGGYKENEFEEYHKKIFVVARAVSEALGKIMNDDFMKAYSPGNLGIAGTAHLDDQYKIDFEADDIVCISDAVGKNYSLVLEKADAHPANQMVVGYTHINYPE
jgi:Domain of Unknown Function (DUF1543)